MAALGVSLVVATLRCWSTGQWHMFGMYPVALSVFVLACAPAAILVISRLA